MDHHVANSPDYSPQDRDMAASSLFANAMAAEFGSCAPADRLEDVLAKLQASASSTFAVIDNGVLIGLLTLGNVSEFIMVRSALRQGTGHPSAQ